ncbi:UNVERIFIED_CONTAM: hypothetical protein GTU68_001454 [Idotea baltica]|nr:hypothetical protein [Idotea baltica]
MEVRPSTLNDVAAMRDIYNHYIAQSHVTFDLEPKSLEERRNWLAQFNKPQHLCLSALDEAGTLLGYACSGEFKAKAAYASSVEVSVYVAANTIQQGIGQRLYEVLLPLLDAAKVHRCYAGIALPNPGSIRLHELHGFQQVAHLSEVGYKFDRYWDVIWMQRHPATTPPKR